MTRKMADFDPIHYAVEEAFVKASIESILKWYRKRKEVRKLHDAYAEAFARKVIRGLASASVNDSALKAVYNVEGLKVKVITSDMNLTQWDDELDEAGDEVFMGNTIFWKGMGPRFSINNGVLQLLRKASGAASLIIKINIHDDTEHLTDIKRSREESDLELITGFRDKIGNKKKPVVTEDGDDIEEDDEDGDGLQHEAASTKETAAFFYRRKKGKKAMAEAAKRLSADLKKGPTFDRFKKVLQRLGYFTLKDSIAANRAASMRTPVKKEHASVEAFDSNEDHYVYETCSALGANEPIASGLAWSMLRSAVVLAAQEETAAEKTPLYTLTVMWPRDLRVEGKVAPVVFQTVNKATNNDFGAIPASVHIANARKQGVDLQAEAVFMFGRSETPPSSLMKDIGRSLAAGVAAGSIPAGAYTGTLTRADEPEKGTAEGTTATFSFVLPEGSPEITFR